MGGQSLQWREANVRLADSRPDILQGSDSCVGPAAGRRTAGVVRERGKQVW